MHPNLFLIITFILILILILIHTPTSLCSDEQQYLNCSKTFTCANIEDIGYPFWGTNRSESCGYPGFELDCTGDAPLLTLANMPYRILSIDDSTYTLNIVRDDYWTDNCPEYLLNTTLDFSLVSYDKTTQNLTLYYGCAVPGLTGQFMCTINDTTSIGYFVTESLTNLTASFGTCSEQVLVPVTYSAVQTIESNFASSNLTAAIHGGFDVQWDANNSLCLKCVASGGQCGHNTTLGGFACYCPDGSTTCGVGSASKSNRVLIILGISTSVAGIAIASIAVTCYLKREHVSSKALAFWKKETEGDQNVEAFIKNYGFLILKRYSYSDVKKMTKSLREKLGQGGYGGVYKGKLPNGRLVAVKVLSESKGNGEEFMNEVASISRTSHVNIVTLLGFCYERTKRALIYEFMPNGSLDNFIYNEGSSNADHHLEWETLYQIAIGIARGLEYLHRGCTTRILHFDIKPHNILLDEDFCPKISDFGLAKLCQRKESIISLLGTRGTIGYIAPEVFSRNFGGVSHKSDVYSYGMMVVEIVGGRQNIDNGVSHSSETYFPSRIYEPLKQGKELKLRGVVTEEEEEITRKMVLVSLWCIQTNPSDRPSMTKVVEMLEGSLQSLQIPPKPFLSSPPRSPQQYSSTTSTISLS